jgi:hypothetical protein
MRASLYVAFMAMGAFAAPIDEHSVAKRNAAPVSDATMELLKTEEAFGHNGNYYTIDGDVTIVCLLTPYLIHYHTNNARATDTTAPNAKTAPASKPP